jgi:hypothetical protein
MTKFGVAAFFLLVLPNSAVDAQTQGFDSRLANAICIVASEDEAVYFAVLNNFGKPDNSSEERGKAERIISDTTVIQEDHDPPVGLWF